MPVFCYISRKYESKFPIIAYYGIYGLNPSYSGNCIYFIPNMSKH